MSLLEVEGLSFRPPSTSLFSPGSGTRKVLTDVSLSIREREIVGLIGGSGSGKTTLARCIAGLIQPSTGLIRFDGRDIHARTNHSFRGTQIQMVFQSGSISLDPCMTVLGSLAEALETSGSNGRTDVRERAEQIMNAVGLQTDLLSRYPRQLSTGQRQRVALARALAAGARLLLLDEPTSGLDVVAQARILSLISTINIQKEMSVLFISHDIPSAFAICSRIYIMSQGRLVENGTPDQLLGSSGSSYTRELLRGAGIVSE